MRDARGEGSLAGRLTRAGFTDTARATRMLGDVALVAAAVDLDVLVTELSDSADPDQALLSLVRIASAAQSSPQAAADLAAVLADPSAAGRLIRVLGASAALGDTCAAHPALVRGLLDPTPGTGVDPAAVRAELLVAVGADPDAEVPVARDGGAETVDTMRLAYRARLARIAMTDLCSGEPLTIEPAVAAALADLAAAAIEAGLAIARAQLPDHGRGVRLCVIGMGKCGGRELNYVSDVDVIYVAEPRDGVPEDEAMVTGARLAAGLARACSTPSGEPALWPVDAALRPEGKDGPLVRTVASHRQYYERWAKTWEFQALLKARPVAGDLALGAEYVAAISPMVWQAVTREGFVTDAQAMRKRVEATVPRAEADRQIKLGRGGLRDVEFTVQLLQLVHGRADESIRSANTLTALAALAAGGYVGRSHAAELAVCYRFLRSLEHRVQLYRLRRTHLLPTSDADLRRLARSLGMRSGGVDALMDRWRQTRRDVRHLHEELFFRPLLPATAQLSVDEASLEPHAAQARLAAVGYRDPAGAVRHIGALTEGLSRRAAIQRQLLPVMIGWFAEGTDPDAGLLAFRRLSDVLGATHWYLKLLRDSGAAARRLARVLATSRFATEAFFRSPESIRWLDSDDELEPLDVERLDAEADAILTRRDEATTAAVAIRALRRREVARTALADILSVVTSASAAESLTRATDVAVAGALRVARWSVRTERGLTEEPSRLLVMAMGRLGGREVGYTSDADVLFVHDPAPGVEASDAQEYATTVAALLRALLGQTGPEPELEVDADLRPEGRNGPLVRSISSYAEYYERWSEPWEAQALLRARPLAGDTDLAERFVALIDPVRYPAGGLPPAAVREVRRIKARVEAERLPRGVDPTRHVKLGRGGIADVEWTIQLLQLCHAHEVPSLRTTSTQQAITAAAEAGLLEAADAETLLAAWRLASRIRDANVLWTGRVGGAQIDVLPHDRMALAGVARLLGYTGATSGDLPEDYLRAARRARAVVDRVFYR